jgi:hypothetical protein
MWLAWEMVTTYGLRDKVGLASIDYGCANKLEEYHHMCAPRVDNDDNDETTSASMLSLTTCTLVQLQVSVRSRSRTSCVLLLSADKISSPTRSFIEITTMDNTEVNDSAQCPSTIIKHRRILRITRRLRQGAGRRGEVVSPKRREDIFCRIEYTVPTGTRRKPVPTFTQGLRRMRKCGCVASGGCMMASVAGLKG